MRKFFHIALILLLSSAVRAQIRILIPTEEQDTIVTSSEVDIQEEEKDANPTEVTLPDTVYCLSTKKQHGWFSPLKTVDLKTAQKAGKYYMFTRRNSAGFWTKMETFNGHGVPTWFGICPYIMRTDDPLGDADWINKVKTGCITIIIADPSGKNVVQEREYDKDMNLLYTYSRVPIGKNKFIGSYKDIYGFPAEMRKDTTQKYTFGTLVVITEDQWGNDSVVEYVDAKGLPKNNIDGVGQSIYIYNEEAQLIAGGSGNHEGDFVLDNKGNCGWKIKYDEKTGYAKERICMNQLWEPMAMPNKDPSIGSTAGVTRVLYKYDDYGRCEEEKYMTLDNKPDTNVYGTHRIEYNYDDYGNLLSMTGFDLKGNLAATDHSGIAKLIAQFDTIGRRVSVECFDKNNKPNSNPEFICKEKSVYSSDGQLDERLSYSFNDGRLDTSYYYIRKKDCEYWRFENGDTRIDSLDSKGRTILIACYNRDGSPRFDKNNGFYRRTTQYIEKGKQLWTITKYYDADGALCGQLPHVCYIFDSLTLSRRVLNYDEKGNLIGTCIQQFDNNDWIIGQSDANGFGTICRNGGISGANHYKAKVLYTQKKEFASLVAIDEFEEPDYVLSYNLAYYYQIMRNSNNVYYDENNQEIKDFKKFIDDCPKAMSIEITDSIAYSYGIKDNDIILRYGNEYQLVENLNYIDFVCKWSIAQVFEASNNKKLLLFRIDPTTKQCSVDTTTLPAGNPSQLGFIAHPILRTQKQMKRQQEAIDAYCKRCYATDEICLWESKLSFEKRDHAIIIAFPTMFRQDRQEPYTQKIIDPSIIVAYQLPTLKEAWSFDEDTKKLEDIMSTRRYAKHTPLLTLYYVKDGHTSQKEQIRELRPGCYFYDYNITEAQFNELLGVLENTKKMIIQEEKLVSKMQINKKQLIGKWQTSITQDNVHADLLLDMSKNGLATLSFNMIIEGDIGNGVFLDLELLVKTNSCKWTLQDSMLSIDSNKAKTEVSITNIDIKGVEGDVKEQMLDMIKDNFELEKKEMTEPFVNSLFDNEELFIKNVSSKELLLFDGNTEILFYKIK